MSKGRLHPPDLKEATQGLSIKKMPPPQEAVLPLLQHTGAACEPKVAVKDKVKAGTLIAEAKDYVSAPIHASISGEVKSIETRPHPVLGQYKAIILASDGQDTREESIKERQGVEALSADEIRKIIRDSGIVGLGGAAFPTQVKLTPPKGKTIDTFILNGAECEPYLTADHRLMVERPKEILAGMKIAMKVLDVSNGFVAIEENKPDALKIFQSLVDGKNIKVIRLKSFYPQGGEKQLIKTTLRRQVPSRGLPFDVGVVVNNVATSLAIYEAVYQNKPLYERALTVSGKMLRQPGNLLVRIGTKVSDIIEFCGGLSEEPAKFIFGGPMMGLAQYTFDVPVIKSTSGIIFLDKRQAREYEEQPCIRCGACVRACPMGLMPCLLNMAADKQLWTEAKDYRAMDCVECALCNYVCPAKRRLTHSVRRAKLEIK